MGDQTQAYDIFQTPLSSGYPLPLITKFLVSGRVTITNLLKKLIHISIFPMLAEEKTIQKINTTQKVHLDGAANVHVFS
jgi:hypothetical protein